MEHTGQNDSDTGVAGLNDNTHHQATVNPLRRYWLPPLIVSGAIGLLLLALWSYRTDGIIAILLQWDLDSAERVDRVRTYFESWGSGAPVIYVLFVIVEVVVAPIPGLILYAPGGMVFGGFWGGLLSLVGNVLGAGVAAEIARLLGGSRIDRLIKQERFKELLARLRNAGGWVVFALRVNPMTTSDLVSYAAGLAGIPTWKIMLGTCVGMAPICWAQAYLVEGLFAVAPWLIYPLVVLCLLYLAVLGFVIWRYVRPIPESSDQQDA